ncbi:MAG: methylmalonyl-CoA carboxyltransferase [Thaumarchaeota archaeon]|nr:methylmalonyl-CoA carboxyltransferase [Candidatus Calditenuaceae archaeon]MDW8187164.1 carboxyl transferase domain-containing protein [Nitrososphaerota archaeon]
MVSPLALRRIRLLLDVEIELERLRARSEVLTGFGTIRGRRVAFCVNDPEVAGGSLSAEGMERVSKLYELAAEEGVPVIYLADSVGARIYEGPLSLNGVAKAYRAMTVASSRVPLLSAVIGASVGGSAFMVASSDVIVGNSGAGYIFVSGPTAVRRFGKMDVCVKELGGVEVLRALGAFDIVRSDEIGCVTALREALSYLPQHVGELPPVSESREAESLELERLPSSDDEFDVRSVIRSVVDRGSFLEFGEEHSKNAVVGLARVMGRPIGLVANQPAIKSGAIDVEAAVKMARFVMLCDKNNLPILTFVDTIGFEPGLEQEHGKLHRHGAKLLHAYATSEVPKVTVLLRRAYAGGFVSMCSKGLGADHVIALSESEVMVQEPRLAAELVKRSEIEAASPEMREEILKAFAEEMRSRYAGGEKLLNLGVVDAVVEPRELRAEIWRALDSLLESYAKRLSVSRKRPLFPV